MPLQVHNEHETDLTPDADAGDDDSVIVDTKRRALEIVNAAHREAETIRAEAYESSRGEPNGSPLAALGDNAAEIIEHVQTLIANQRQLKVERQELLDRVHRLKDERDELVQRLTDAVARMEEMAAEGAAAARRPTPIDAAGPPEAPPPVAPPVTHPPDSKVDDNAAAHELDPAGRASIVDPDGRSFYSRRSAKLPRLEGEGGRSVLTSVGDMRPHEPEGRGRRGRRARRKP